MKELVSAWENGQEVELISGKILLASMHICKHILTSYSHINSFVPIDSTEGDKHDEALQLLLNLDKPLTGNCLSASTDTCVCTYLHTYLPTYSCWRHMYGLGAPAPQNHQGIEPECTSADLCLSCF